MSIGESSVAPVSWWFEPSKLRWGGFGTIVLGLAISSGGAPAAVVFGLVVVVLGVLTWGLTGFGRYTWQSLSPASHGIAGTGAVVGVLFFFVTFGIVIAFLWFVNLFFSDN